MAIDWATTTLFRQESVHLRVSIITAKLELREMVCQHHKRQFDAA